MTLVRTVTRHTGCTGFAPITLPAAPWEAGEAYQPRRAPQTAGATYRPSECESAVIAVLRAAEGPETTRRIMDAAGLSEKRVRRALHRLESRRAIRRVDWRPGKAATWSLPDA